MILFKMISVTSGIIAEGTWSRLPKRSQRPSEGRFKIEKFEHIQLVCQSRLRKTQTPQKPKHLPLYDTVAIVYIYNWFTNLDGHPEIRTVLVSTSDDLTTYNL